MMNVEIRVMGKFLDQGIPSDPKRRQRIVSMIKELATDEHGSIRKSVVRVLGRCLNWDMLSDPERLEIFYKIAERLFDKHDSVMKTAEREVKRLWRSDFPIAEKSEIVSFVAESLLNPDYNKRGRALEVIWDAVLIGVPVDFTVLDNVVSQVSEPAPVGPIAEKIIRAFLDEDGLSKVDRMLIELKLKSQLSAAQAQKKQKHQRVFFQMKQQIPPPHYLLLRQIQLLRI